MKQVGPHGPDCPIWTVRSVASRMSWSGPPRSKRSHLPTRSVPFVWCSSQRITASPTVERRPTGPRSRPGARGRRVPAKVCTRVSPRRPARPCAVGGRRPLLPARPGAGDSERSRHRDDEVTESLGRQGPRCTAATGLGRYSVPRTSGRCDVTAAARARSAVADAEIDSGADLIIPAMVGVGASTPAAGFGGGAVR